MINPRVDPWNVYGDWENYDLSVTANVYAGGYEWYNSFMPPFFLLEDVELISEIKKVQDNNGSSIDDILGTTPLGKKYWGMIQNAFSERNMLYTLNRQFDRISNFFKMESRLSNFYNDHVAPEDTVAQIHCSINLMQTYLNPLEAFTTGKRSRYNPIDRLFSGEDEQLTLLRRSPSIESIFIPLAVLKKNRVNNGLEYSSVFNLLKRLLFCSEKDLNFALDYTETKYGYSKYMERSFAEQIIDNSSNKIPLVDDLSMKEKVAYFIQAINGILTWSKYIPLSYEPLRFRYFFEIETLDDFRSLPLVKNKSHLFRETEVSTTSGSEKYAKNIYLMNTLLSSSDKFEEMITMKSMEYWRKLHIPL